MQQQPVQALPNLSPLQMVADTVRNGGNVAAAAVAAHWHPANTGAVVVTFVELHQRIIEAQIHFGPSFIQFNQGRSQAIALRLLAPVAGPGYDFDQVETTHTDAQNKTVTGFKCGGPNCEFRGKDQKRHMQAVH
ncbi:hypothetical protein Daus18300_002215, partial [Diaporthe australafricana]